VDFFREHVLSPGADRGARDKFYAYQTATVITNCMFLVNFAVNFILRSRSFPPPSALHLSFAHDVFVRLSMDGRLNS